MPELPEVEIIKRELSNNISKKKITNFYSSGLKLHGKDIPDLSVLVNETIFSIYRRNKYLILETESKYILIHLGMTGQLIFSEKLPENQKHIHAIIYFQTSLLYYKDVRRFGKIELYDKKQISNYLDIPVLSKLGFEPLDDSFTYDKLSKLIDNSKMSAKQFIMNGEYVCGLGNIYANEVLFLSGIHPLNLIKDITKNQKKLLFNNIKIILSKAIDLGGSSISDYVNSSGQKGNMQNHYYVYARDRQKCKNCSFLIEKIKQNGRSTFYCPNCQKHKNNNKK